MCIGKYFHRFNIQRETTNWVEEICEICGKQEIYTFVDGRIDNNRYAINNERLFIRTSHQLFEHEYGKK